MKKFLEKICAILILVILSVGFLGFTPNRQALESGDYGMTIEESQTVMERSAATVQKII